MGRRSDTDDDYDLKKSKKKKKRHSRSRSSSSGSSRYSSKHKKSKKTKHRKRSQSRSREKVIRRSRSRSRGRRSRSRDKYRSRSHSRERYPSRSRERYRSKSRDRYIRRRSRSDSRGRNRRSRSRSRGRRSRTPDKKKSRSKKESPTPKDIQADIREQVPGFDDMTPGEKGNARMKLALKAAAAADEKIREQLGSEPSTSEEMTNFTKAVLDIESGNFKPAAFKSSRDVIKTVPVKDGYTTHDQAMFGAGKIDIKMEPMMKPVYVEPDSYAHPNLHCDPNEKMERWIQKLSAMRKRKLEGEAL